MQFTFKPLDQQIIVITGASSGIGFATARAAAAKGARLVLASRNEETLTAVVQEIVRAGGEAIHVVADVARREEVQRIADGARARFGGFDTWVNNAGHSIYGRLEEISEEDHRRLFETNFWGVVHGSLLALQELKQRGGALINLGSVASDNAIPLQGMYSASKHAVKGFTDALRMELEAEQAPVSVTLIKPTGIDTPFPQHARNYLEKEPKLPAPVYPPEEVARAILYAATHAKRDIYIGGGARAASTLGRIAPRAMDRVSSRIMPEEQQRDEPPRDPQGTLYAPGVDGRVHGDHPGHVMRSSLYTRASLHPVVSGAILAAGIAAVAMMRRDSGPRRIERRRERRVGPPPERAVAALPASASEPPRGAGI
jgi:short-subunit dehydrogenase